jgi:hypothetical protein
VSERKLGAIVVQVDQRLAH